MGWLESLPGEVVAIDSAPLIYFIEEHPAYLATLVPFFELVEKKAVSCVTSVVTLTEVLVLPLRHNRLDLADKYRDILLGSSTISTLPITASIARLASEYRATFNLRTPDAYQLAAARIAGATSFLTNDSVISAVPGLDVVLLSQIDST